MSLEFEPFVSVVTPVYNMESFLPECIESILTQSYKNFEYIIVNNCSTDNTLEVALSYAKRDSRVQVYTNDQFVGMRENHNIAFSRISPAAKYCKVVSADDFIFPDCIKRLVECAEANPSVGIVGSYQLSEDRVRWQGFPYPKAVFSGREMCRNVFLGGDQTFGFGCPTSVLYRADLIRKREEFYSDPPPHEDTSACFRELQHSDYGFVYQVLSYMRPHAGTQSALSAKMNFYIGAYLADLLHYGPLCLTKEEFDGAVRNTLNGYYGYLAVNALRFRGPEFWEYHRKRLGEMGFTITTWNLAKGFIRKGLGILVAEVRDKKRFFAHVA